MDRAVGQVLKTRDAAQERGFPATRRAKETDEGSVRKAKVDAFEHLDRTKRLPQPRDPQFRQAPPLPRLTPEGKLYVFSVNEIVFI
jgi:hypothetical protein